MKGKLTIDELLVQIVLIIITAALALVCLYPVYYVLCASFSEPQQFLNSSGLIVKPLGFSLETYKCAFEHPLLINSYGVTIFVLIVGTALNLLMSTLGAFIMSRRNLYFQKFLSIFIIFTMYFTGGIIPGYLIAKGLGILDTVWAMILPTAINTYNMIILRTAFYSVPYSIEEAAKIDGANSLVVLFRILIPLTLPSMAVIMLYYAVHHWNAWFHASIYITDTDLYPLQIVMRQILMQGDSKSMTTGVDSGEQLAINQTLKYAVIIVATVPMLILYPFLQKFFTKGVMVGGVKG